MKDLQEIFNRIEENKQKLRETKKILRDALSNSGEHQKAKAAVELARDKKRNVEQAIRAELPSENEKIEELTADIQADQLLINDVALTSLTEGQAIKITDKNSNEYEPVFSVKFRKIRG